MRTQDSVKSIRDDLAALRPGDVKARVLELTRGGHRPASFSMGPGGGDTILPAFDKPDLEIQGLDRDYRDALNHAAKWTAVARQKQEKILAKARVKKLDDDNVPADEVWCLSCLRVDAFQPRGNPKRQGADTVLCSWCFDNQTDGDDEGGITEDGIIQVWPSLPLVNLHIDAQGQGRYITSKMLKEAGIEVEAR